MKIAKIIRALAVALLCSLTAGLEAQTLYVSTPVNLSYENNADYVGVIGEYGLDGVPVKSNLVVNATLPGAMAISGNYLYVINNSNTIATYGLDGTLINPSLVTGLSSAIGLAISGTNLFVANQGNGTNGTIGKYTLTGQTVNAALISGLTNLSAMAVAGTNVFVASFGATSPNGIIAEYNTAGQTLAASLIPGLTFPTAMVVAGTNLLIANLNVTTDASSIGEYTTSGQTLNAALIPISGLPVVSLAVSGTNLFVGNLINNTINKYTTSGSPLAVPLVSTYPVGLAIAPPPPLSITTAGNQNILYYPAWGAGYVLQQVTNLASTNWVTVSNTAPIISVAVTNNLPASYYRLLPP